MLMLNSAKTVVKWNLSRPFSAKVVHPTAHRSTVSATMQAELEFKLPSSRATTHGNVSSEMLSMTGKVWSTHAQVVADLSQRFLSSHMSQASRVKSSQDVNFNESTLIIPAAHKETAHHLPRKMRHVIALHGWLDNANTWDVVMPQLFKQLSASASDTCWVVVALDFAGHGWSSHRTYRHSAYTFASHCMDIMDITAQLGWQGSFDLLGHSMGAAVGSVLAASFPEHVRSLLMVENLGPFTRPVELMPGDIQIHYEQVQRLNAKRSPLYATIEAAVDARQKGTANGTLSRRGAELLVERGHRVVNVEGKSMFTWRTDSLLMGISPYPWSEDQVLAFLASIKCRTLLVIARQGYKFHLSAEGKKSPYPWIDWNARFRAIKNIDAVQVDGGHHVHMDDNNQVSDALAQFLLSDRPKSKL